jgi:hypothetical protein
MRGQVADIWHAADVSGKLELLTKAMQAKIPLSIEFLDEETSVLDELAFQAGLVPIFESTVDVAGISGPTPAVAGPDIAGRYRARKSSKMLELNMQPRLFS